MMIRTQLLGISTVVLLAIWSMSCTGELDDSSDNQSECEPGQQGCTCLDDDTCSSDLQCVGGECIADDVDDVGTRDDASEPPDTQPQPIDGECGSNSGEHYREVHQWPGEFCEAGSLDGDAPEMPNPLSSTSWSCEGEHGGETVECTSTRVDDCSPQRRAPDGWSQITGNCDPQNYADGCTEWGPGGIWPVGFPGGDGNTRRLASGLGEISQYLSIEIQTFDELADAYGRIRLNSAGQPIPNVPQHIMSISSCPGDFNKEAIMDDTACYGRITLLSSIRWRGPDAEPSGVYETDCVLQPDRTYFWNMIPSNSEPGTDPEDLEVDPQCLEGELCGAIYNPDLGYPDSSDLWPYICDPDNPDQQDCPE